MAPRALYMAAILARELFLYAMTNSLCVVVGGHEVRVVGVAYEDVGALVNCAKYRRKREGGLFSNNAKKKKSAKFKSIREKRVTSFLLNCTVIWGKSSSIWNEWSMLPFVKNIIFDSVFHFQWKEPIICAKIRLFQLPNKRKYLFRRWDPPHCQHRLWAPILEFPHQPPGERRESRGRVQGRGMVGAHVRGVGHVRGGVEQRQCQGWQCWDGWGIIHEHTWYNSSSGRSCADVSDVTQ